MASALKTALLSAIFSGLATLIGAGGELIEPNERLYPSKSSLFWLPRTGASLLSIATDARKSSAWVALVLEEAAAAGGVLRRCAPNSAALSSAAPLLLLVPLVLLVALGGKASLTLARFCGCLGCSAACCCAVKMVALLRSMSPNRDFLRGAGMAYCGGTGVTPVVASPASLEELRLPLDATPPTPPEAALVAAAAVGVGGIPVLLRTMVGWPSALKNTRGRLRGLGTLWAPPFATGTYVRHVWMQKINITRKKTFRKNQLTIGFNALGFGGPPFFNAAPAAG